MKKIIFLFLFIFIFLVPQQNVAAGDFSLGGYIEGGFFPLGNEFNPPGTIYGPQKILTHVARYALRAKLEVRYKKIFLIYKPALYLGNNRPGQCKADGKRDPDCLEGQSYDAPPLVYYQKINFGVSLNKNTEVYVETGRTFWPSPKIAQGDAYMYSGVFVRYTFGGGEK